MQEESMVHCLDPACARLLARRVNFCPYCGAAQHGGAVRAPGGPGAAMPAATIATPAAVAADVPAPAADTAPAAPEPVRPTPPPSAVPPAAAAAQAVPPPAAPVSPPAPAASPAAPPRRWRVGPGSGPGTPAAGAPAAGAPAAGAPTGAPAAGPGRPARQPVRLRWWLLGLALLWVFWLIFNPSKRRIEAQMDKAIALAVDCKPREAQDALIALRKTKAKPEQLREVQTALNDAGAACTRKRQRDKAWREARDAVEALLGSSPEKARQRLRAFTRRWGEDGETKALKQEIDERAPEHRRADEVLGEAQR